MGGRDGGAGEGRQQVDTCVDTGTVLVPVAIKRTPVSAVFREKNTELQKLRIRFRAKIVAPIILMEMGQHTRTIPAAVGGTYMAGEYIIGNPYIFIHQ
jgi:hypothetical protein